MGKAKSVTTTYVPGEAGPFHAKEALRHGDERGVGYFARDHAEALSLLADLFDPPEGTARKLQFVSHLRQRPKAEGPTPHDEDPEWEGALVEVKDAINTESLALIGRYLRDAADVYRRVGDALDPPSGSRGWRLEFVRQRRGRPSDPNKMFRDSAIRVELLVATRKAGGKQDSAIADLKGKGISRATAFRAKKKVSNGVKSQKKGKY